jgi:hypothetical protein
MLPHSIALRRTLKDRLERARAKNASYSIRALAKKAGVSASTMSLFLLGKREISVWLADKMVRNLALRIDERNAPSEPSDSA